MQKHKETVLIVASLAYFGVILAVAIIAPLTTRPGIRWVPYSAAGLVLGGILYAAFLEHTRLGQFIDHRLTFLAVIIGTLATLGLAIPVIGITSFLYTLLAFACSGLGIAGRAMIVLAREDDAGWADIRQAVCRNFDTGGNEGDDT